MRTWPWVFILAIAVMTLVVVGITWMVRNRFPPVDYRWTFSADLQRPQFSTQQVRAAIAEEARQIVDGALIEKVVLTSLVALSFAQVLSEVRASSLMLVLGVGAIVIVNTTISHWIARRRFGWGVTIGQFWLLAAVNTILILGYSVIRTALDQPVRVPNAFFFVLLLTLLLTLFDRYRQIYLIRFGPRGTGRPYHDVSNSQDSLLD
jgi:hypothetical protein